VKTERGTKCFLVSGQLPIAGTFDFRGDKIKRALLPATGRRNNDAPNDRGNELRDTTVRSSAPFRSVPTIASRRRLKEDEVVKRANLNGLPMLEIALMRARVGY